MTEEDHELCSCNLPKDGDALFFCQKCGGLKKMDMPVIETPVHKTTLRKYLINRFFGKKS